MAMQLKIDEMLEAAQDSAMPGYAALIVQAETLAGAIARALADHLDIFTNPEEATFQPGFGGLCAPFYAARPGQECPECIERQDEGGDWGTVEELRAEMEKLAERYRPARG